MMRDDLREEVVKAVNAGLAITAVADASGVSRQTVHAWIRASVVA